MTQSESTATQRKKILIVDDSALVRLYYTRVLENAGFDVEQAINGIEGLEKILGQDFDLAIVDVNMPRMDGLSLVRELRRSRRGVAALPALIVTTEANLRDFEEARTAGANFYLVKPVSEIDLLRHAEALAGVPA